MSVGIHSNVDVRWYPRMLGDTRCWYQLISPYQLMPLISAVPSVDIPIMAGSPWYHRQPWHPLTSPLPPVDACWRPVFVADAMLYMGNKGPWPQHKIQTGKNMWDQESYGNLIVLTLGFLFTFDSYPNYWDPPNLSSSLRQKCSFPTSAMAFTSSAMCCHFDKRLLPNQKSGIDLEFDVDSTFWDPSRKKRFEKCCNSLGISLSSWSMRVKFSHFALDDITCWPLCWR